VPTVGELLDALDDIAPSHLAYADDPIGLHVGRKSDAFERAVVALDVTPAAVEYAASLGASVIVAHHPPIYHPLKNVAGDSLDAQVIRGSIKHGIALVAAHTNWDAANGGVNDSLASLLSLSEVTPFGNDLPAKELKLSVFVPLAETQRLIDALAAAGAGGMGLYRRCAFFAEGTGTFEPQEGASPAIGEVGAREEVEEMRVEMRVPAHCRDAVEKVLLGAHPYEEPAYDFFRVEAPPASLGRMGKLPEPVRFGELRGYVDRALGSRCELFGKLERKVSTVGVVGGAGGDFWTRAKSAGCDVLVTGECAHHHGRDAAETGFCVIEAGHYHTEHPGMVVLCERLRQAMPSASFDVYEPAKGRCGRPD
jgi:dinuclear metal center YbgI/SA1388 family protein